MRLPRPSGSRTEGWPSHPEEVPLGCNDCNFRYANIWYETLVRNKSTIPYRTDSVREKQDSPLRANTHWSSATNSPGSKRSLMNLLTKSTRKRLMRLNLNPLYPCSPYSDWNVNGNVQTRISPYNIKYFITQSIAFFQANKQHFFQLNAKRYTFCFLKITS